MIRAIITVLFATPNPASWVPGLGMLALPGVLRDRRHGRQRNERGRVPSNGNISDLSGEVSV